MIEAFVKRPATTIIFISFFVVLGIVSYFNLQSERYPKIDFPIATVRVVYPGASPSEIETQVIKKVEDAVVEIAQIKNLNSRSYENFGYVIIEFELGADINVKASEVKDKVEAIVNDLPKGIEKPIIERIDPFATPVVYLTLSSDVLNGKDLYEYADKKLKNQFAKIKGVGTIDIFGGEIRQINIDLDPNLLKRYFLSITDVIETIRLKNLNVPGGNLEAENYSLAVRFLGEFLSIEDIRSLVITNPEGQRVQLSQIGHIYDGHKRQETMARFNSFNTVSLSIRKISDGNAVEVASSIKSLLPEIEKSLPQNMKLDLAVDTSTNIIIEERDTLSGIIIGILLTVLVLYVFSGNVNITMISAIVIPSSIVSTMLLADFSGFTINFMTLLAIATALGTLIANAIVIIENVLVHLQMGKSPQQAAIDGTKEVVIPVIASAGTNLVVFTPIAFMGGIVGQFMKQFGLTVVYATLFSILASFTLTPMLCALLLKKREVSSKKSRVLALTDSVVAFLLQEYKTIYNIMFRYPKTWLVGCLILLLGSCSVVPYIGNEFIPISDQDRIEVAINLPQGSTLENTLTTVKDVEKVFDNIPEVKSKIAILGRNGAENASLVLNLYPFAERTRDDVAIIEEITPELAKIPGAEFEIIRGEGGGGQEADMTIQIFGEDLLVSNNITQQMMEIMKTSGNFRSVASSYKKPKSEVQFIPDQKKLELYGVNNDQLARLLRSSIYGDDTNVYKENSEEYDIMVRLDEDVMDNKEAISQIHVITNKGLIPITDLGELRVTKATPAIWRRERNRIIQIDAYLAKSTAGAVQAELNKEFAKLELPPGYTYKFAGNAESQDESGREIGKAFGLAIILTYMILVAILNSFVHPITISSSIITSFSGVFLLMFFMEYSINIASMLAFVMLVGLVVNNAILILDQVENIIKRGEDNLIEAIWRGCEDKFRAVLMTSIAIVTGAVPQMFAVDGGKASMGGVIVGGTLASIVFSFFLIPVIYWYLERFRRWILKFRSQKLLDVDTTTEDGLLPAQVFQEQTDG